MNNDGFKSICISGAFMILVIILLSLSSGCTSIQYKTAAGDEMHVTSLFGRKHIENLEMLSEPNQLLLDVKGYSSDQDESLRMITKALEAYLETKGP